MAMEIVNTVVGKAVDYLFTAVGNQLGYLVHYNDYVRNLRRQTDKLKGARERVQERIDEAKKKNEIIESDVLRWLAEVDAIILQAESFLEDKSNATKSWCVRYGSHYNYSKEAQNKTLLISELLQEYKNLESVSRPAPPPGIQSFSSVNIDAFQSQKLAMEGIVEFLKSNHIQIIGVCGMGGVGKTTIVTEVGKKVKESNLFHEVAMAVVSQTVDVAKIQDTIAHMLGIDLPRTDVSERARSLWASLSNCNKKTLVILDDVWSWLDLDAVGIPSGKDCPSCKVLITSRSRDVCNEMKAQKFIEVELLSDYEAWVLFREIVGEAVDTYDLEPIAQEIVYECGRLPLAILSVGRNLRNKSKEAWKVAISLLKRSAPPNSNPMLRQVFPKLELSYNFLENKEMQSLFLLCCLFPENSNIPLESLVRYGVGLRLFEDVDYVEEARARVQAVVSTLKAAYLLLDGKDKGHTKMHDVVRDVAINIASKGDNIFLVKAGIGLREWPERDTYDRYTAISVMSNRISKLPVGSACKNLQALLLQHNPLQSIPGSFFEGMRELKVIDLCQEQWGVPMSLPISFTLLTNLRTLCIDGLYSLDISVIGQLKRLEILSLARSYIVEIPQPIGELTNLRLLDLSTVKCQIEIVPGVISSLSKLEELYTDYNNSVIWMKADTEKRILIELKPLSRITCLNIKLPNTHDVPDDLYLPELSRYFVNIGGIDWTPEIDCLKTLILFNMQSRFPGWILNLSKHAEGLYVSHCSCTENLFYDLNSSGLNDVRDLSLYVCKGIKCLVDTTNLALQPVFCSLEKICIRYLGDLVEMSHGPLSSNSFRNVKSIQVSNCSNLLRIVGYNFLRNLSNLRTFIGDSCEKVVCVFELEEVVTGKERTKVLSNLEDLQLLYLNGMEDIWKGPHESISLTNLVKVYLDLCPKLKRLFSPTLVDGLVNLDSLELSRCYGLEVVFETYKEHEETGVWENAKGKVLCLRRLRVVRVMNCKKLKNIFPHSVAFNLEQLIQLEVDKCISMEEIVGGRDQEGREAGPFVYPNLELFKFRGCPELKTFGHGLHLTPKLKKVQDLVLIDDINTAVQQIYKYELIRKYESEEDVAVAFAKYVSILSDKYVKEKGSMSVVLSGGSVIKTMRKLTEPPYNDLIDWSKWLIFWVDERVVPLTDPRSNYKLAYDGFISKVGIPAKNIYNIDDKLSPEEAADDYESRLKNLVEDKRIEVSKASGFPKFDLMILGMGPDGDIGSLFPGHPQCFEKKRWVTFVKNPPKQLLKRITMTLPVINSASDIALVVTGADLAEITSIALGKSANSPKARVLPVQMVRPEGKLALFLDNDSASKL